MDIRVSFKDIVKEKYSFFFFWVSIKLCFYIEKRITPSIKELLEYECFWS